MSICVCVSPCVCTCILVCVRGVCVFYVILPQVTFVTALQDFPSGCPYPCLFRWLLGLVVPLPLPTHTLETNLGLLGEKE